MDVNDGGTKEKLFALVYEFVERLIVPIASALDAQRTGGYFACMLVDPGCHTGNDVVGERIGMVSEERFQKYERFAREKIDRLSQHPDHVSSWQSRDEQQERYGGAIRCTNGAIFSFSGFPEHLDEMLCVLVAQRSGLIDNSQIGRMIKASNNEPLREYLKNLIYT